MVSETFFWSDRNWLKSSRKITTILPIKCLSNSEQFLSEKDDLQRLITNPLFTSLKPLFQCDNWMRLTLVYLVGRHPEIITAYLAFWSCDDFLISVYFWWGKSHCMDRLSFWQTIYCFQFSFLVFKISGGVSPFTYCSILYFLLISIDILLVNT